VGHEIDYTISDFVADKRAKTPTDAAQMVIPKKEELLARIEELSGRLDSNMMDKITFLRDELETLAESYILKQPINIIEQYQQRIDELARHIAVRTGHIFDIKEAEFATVCGKLDMLSPLRVLSRGYSITTRTDSGKVLKDAAELKKGDEVKTKLAKGEFISEVKDG
jgi:exodeoxyribonuclease VII large subunit